MTERGRVGEVIKAGQSYKWRGRGRAGWWGRCGTTEDRLPAIKENRVPDRSGDAVPSGLASAKGEVRGQAALTRLLVLRAHVAAGLGQGLDGRVEIDAVPRRDL